MSITENDLFYVETIFEIFRSCQHRHLKQPFKHISNKIWSSEGREREKMIFQK